MTAAREAGTVGIGMADVEDTTAAPRAAAAGAPAVATSRCPSCGVPSDGLCGKCEEQRTNGGHDEHERKLYELDHDPHASHRLRDERDEHHPAATGDGGGDD